MAALACAGTSFVPRSFTRYSEGHAEPRNVIKSGKVGKTNNSGVRILYACRTSQSDVASQQTPGVDVRSGCYKSTSYPSQFNSITANSETPENSRKRYCSVCLSRNFFPGRSERGARNEKRKQRKERVWGKKGATWGTGHPTNHIVVCSPSCLFWFLLSGAKNDHCEKVNI